MAQGRLQEIYRMQNVTLAAKSVTDYAAIVGEEVIAELEWLARPLQGARVVHVSSTAYGGGGGEKGPPPGSPGKKGGPGGPRGGSLLGPGGFLRPRANGQRSTGDGALAGSTPPRD